MSPLKNRLIFAIFSLIILHCAAPEVVNDIDTDDDDPSTDTSQPPSVGLRFLNEPPSKIDFSNNTGKRIDCQVATADQSSPTIIWTFLDGTPVSNLKGLRQVSSADGSLNFAPFSSEQFRQDVHAAVYRCVVTSDIVGTIVSRDVKVRAVMDVEYDSSVYDVFAIRGNMAVVKCHVPTFLQDFVSIVSYIKDDSLKIASTKDIDTKFTLTSHGSLYIRDVGTADAGTSYKCQTYHHLTGKMRISSGSGRVFVTDPHGNIPPRIVDTVTVIQAKTGDDVLLPCVAHGHPLPQTTWTFKSRSLPDDHSFKKSQHGLYVDQVKLSDGGKYICYINNSVGSDEAEILLTVLAPMTVSLNPSYQVVDIGKPMSLSCNVTDSPSSARIWWLKNGQEVDPRKLVSADKRQFRVDSMGVDDKGMYQCFARNDVEIVQSTAQIKIGDFPPILRETFAQVTTEPGQSVSFTCVADGSPAPDIKWTLDTVPLDNSDNVIIESKAAKNGQVVSSINIKSSSLEDGGVYTCSVMNPVGTVKHSARLNVYGPLTARKISPLNFVAGSDVQLNCPVHGYPIDNVEWEKKDNAGTPVAIQEGVMPNFTLLIQNVQRAEDSGDYLCTVTNKIGQKANAEIQVAIKVLPKIIPFTFQEDLLREGMRARIQCVVSEGDSPVSIKWTKDGLIFNADNLPGITVQNVDEYSSILAIRAVGPRHNGNYTCTASNTAGRARHSARLFVNALPKIIPFAFQDDQNFKGMRAHIICAVSQGDLPLSFSWLKDGRPIETHSLGAQIGSYDRHSSSLSVDSVASKHSGNYTCVAANQAGQATFTAQLVVQVAPKVVPFSFQGDHMFEGVLARVSCVIYQGDLPIDIQWFKDGRQINKKVFEGVSIQNVDAYTSILTIDNVLSRHSGNYSCLANNSASSVRHTAQLVVKVPPKIVPFAFQEEGLVEGMFVRVSCVVSRGDLPLFITWTKDSQTIPRNLDITIRSLDEYSSVLSIDSINPSHSGNYTCLANNSAATTAYSSPLIVHVPPRWSKTFNGNTTATLGSWLKLDCEANGNPRPDITWMKGQDKYPLSPKTPLKDKSNVRIFRNGTLLISKLEDTDEGFYFCKVTNGIGKGLSGVMHVKVSVPPKNTHKSNAVTVKLSQMAILQCTFSGDSPIKITWTANEKPMQINRYQIKESKEGKTISTELAILKVVASDNQMFGCAAENQFGKAFASIPVRVLSPPNAPKNVHVKDLGNKSVELAWSASSSTSKAHTNPIEQYIVEYHVENENPQTEIVSGANTRLVLKDLQPSSKYKFIVFAKNEIGQSEPGTVVEWSMAGETPGSPPRDIQVQAQNGKSLRVAWQPPPQESWNGNIHGYYVGYRETESDDPSFEYKLLEVPEGYDKGLSFTLTDLKQFTKYSIVLQAFNDHGKGPTSPEVLVMTSEGVPNKAPLAVDCSPTSSQSIIVNWQPPPQASINGILRGHRVLYWTSPPSWYGETTLGIQNMTTGTDDTKVTLRGLSKHSNYSIQVLAYTLVGDGVASKPIYCQTMEDVPSAPRGIKVLPATFNSLLVIWAPPAYPNGIITQYTVYVAENKQNTNPTRNILRGNFTSYEVRNLPKNTRGTFSVSATTVVGEGPSTPPVTANLTRTKVPAQCAIFNDVFKQRLNKPLIISCPAVGFPSPNRSWLFRGQPLISSERVAIQPDGSLQIAALQMSDAGNYTCRASNDFGRDEVLFAVIVQVPPSIPTLVVTSTSPTTVDLYWKQPSSGHSQILGYILHYKQQFGIWQSVELQPYLNAFQLRGLQCGTTYQMHLTASNEVGNGQQSEMVIIKTDGSVPSVPTVGDLLESSSTHVVLHLDAWLSNGCPIIYFVIEYKQKTSRSWSLASNNLLPEKSDMILRELDADTIYSLRMTAHTSAGSSVAEYDFTTQTGNDGTLSDGDEMLAADDILAIFNVKILLSIIACGVAIVVCLAATCLWVTHKRESRPRTRKSKNSETNRGRNSSSSSVIPRNSMPRIDSDEEISPYAMVKLSDFQNGDPSSSRMSQPTTSGMNKQFPLNNYNPTAPPMSESYSPYPAGMALPEHPRRYPVLGRPTYAMPNKEKLRHLREVDETRQINAEGFLNPPPPMDEETTFVFPPPPDERDGDYDPPPPELDWLPNIKQ